MTPETSSGERFRLYSVDVLDALEDREWFIEATAQFYDNYARAWGCYVTLSDRRLGDAWDFWQDDAYRTSKVGIDSKHDADVAAEEIEGEDNPLKLDHFKHASMIAFWLRRVGPLNTMWGLTPERTSFVADDYALDKFQDHFIQYGSELAALMVGFHIILSYEIASFVEPGNASMRKDALSRIRVPFRFIYEYPRLLKHKNVSSQAIYMLYRSLFDEITLSEPAQ